MSTNVEVTRNGSENNVALLRRFTKRVQGSGVLPRVRSIRYASRKQSEYVKQKKTLKTLARREEVQTLIKKGLLQENAPRKKR